MKYKIMIRKKKKRGVRGFKKFLFYSLERRGGPEMTCLKNRKAPKQWNMLMVYEGPRLFPLLEE